MLFSIIVPIYKVEDCLEQCINSLVSQTFSDIEIILVDDGSPDKCPEICNEYAKNDKRIKVIHKENGGLSDARNAGLDIATGKYIILVDSDDYIDKNTCEMLIQYTVLNPDIIVCDAILEGGQSGYFNHVCYEEGGIYSGMEYLKEGYKDSRLSWVPMAAWLNVYNRDFLNKNKLRFKYGILHEDEEFTPRVLLVADKIIYSGVRFYHYVVRNDSITTKIDKRKNIKDFTDTALELEEMYKNIEDIELQKYMRDSLARKYLSIYWSGRIYKYGSRYTNRRFVMRNANNINTRMKAILFFLSPAIYCGINDFFKKICESR